MSDPYQFLKIKTAYQDGNFDEVVKLVLQVFEVGNDCPFEIILMGANAGVNNGMLKEVLPLWDFLYNKVIQTYNHSGRKKITYNYSQILNNIGSSMSTTDPNLARNYFEKALMIHSENSSALYNLGVMEKDEGELIKAEHVFKQFLTIEPKDLAARILLAEIVFEKGDWKACRNLLLTVNAEKIQDVKLLNRIGKMHHIMGDVEQAQFYFNAEGDAESLGKAVEIAKLETQKPVFNFDTVIQGAYSASTLARFDKAISLWEFLYQSEKDDETIIHGYSQCLASMGLERRRDNPEAALKLYRHALDVWKENHSARVKLATLAKERHYYEETEAILQDILKYKPTSIESRIELLDIQLKLKKFPEAYRTVENIDLSQVSDIASIYTIIELLRKLGDGPRIREVAQKLLTLLPNNWHATCLALLSVSQVFWNEADRESENQIYLSGLEKLTTKKFPIISVEEASLWVNFYTPYQPRNVRDSQIKYAKALERALGNDVNQPQSYISFTRGETPKICLVSDRFSQGVIGEYFGSWVSGLRTRGFQVALFHLGPSYDQLTEKLISDADVGQVFDNTQTLLSEIKKYQPHIIIYPEIGMNVKLNGLAAKRLASIQCVAWGHPLTTGFTEIDYFISSSLEPENAEEHYSESLIKLPGLGTCYQPQRIGDQNDIRARYNLSKKTKLFLMSQHGFKVLPENDEVWACILKRVPDSKLLTFERKKTALGYKFKTRFMARLEEYDLRYDDVVIELPSVPRDEYLELNLHCVCMLDTVNFSGGSSSLDALSVGLPIVTWNGSYMRGRQSAGMLEILGVSELIANTKEDYINLAVKLAMNESYLEEIKAKILNHQQQLFNDVKPLDVLAEKLMIILNSGDSNVT